ncbi:protein tilB homolog isoform X4 [Alosa sapidissima]|uniref:protein tilB homolog isoform X4 n=1 Tax=Alosa sapidissima TaxID=34773 RepID=UPI001C099E2B|nr:protein tilB homolog isoform X4 [Alosa sapidissima]
MPLDIVTAEGHVRKFLRSEHKQRQSPQIAHISLLRAPRHPHSSLSGTEPRLGHCRHSRPTEEELFLRGEQNALQAAEERQRRRRRRREDEGQKWEERLQENWENCVELNLSYQDLGDPYQLENFTRILRRLIRVERLQLVDNSLSDLSSVRLPRCKYLNLHRNHLTSIRQLPKMPQIQHLCLSENGIGALGELALLGATPLQSLTLRRNPCEFLEDYRPRVFSCLPKLRVLDGILKLPEDSVPSQISAASRLCTIL